MNYYMTAETPLGEFIIAEEEGRITRLFLSHKIGWIERNRSEDRTQGNTSSCRSEKTAS